MAKLHDFKVRGLTAASVTLSTTDIEYHDDGSIRFTTASGEKVVMQPTANLNKLLKMVLVGTGGFTTGKAWFGA